jgi:hypothetical protein
MKLSLLSGLAVGLLALAAPPAIAAPANVIVRVEGAAATLVEPTRVTTSATPVTKGGEECSGTSAGGALDRATNGNWEATHSSFGHFITSILGEAPAGTSYWAVWHNNRYSPVGACGLELQEGDQVLFLLDRCDEFDPEQETCRDQVLPLALTAPATATQGAATQVTVVSYDRAGATAPVAGARVTGPGVDVTTDGAGQASIVFGQTGTVRLRAEKDGFVRSQGHDVAVSAPAAPAPAAVPDRAAPAGTLPGFTDKQVFRRGPRQLSGSFAADASGIRMVKLRLTKRLGKRCWYFSGRMERFRRTRCGRGFYFAIGDRADWTYLLPERLERGRYVLDAVAIDGAGNRTPLARGTSRVVFTVR